MQPPERWRPLVPPNWPPPESTGAPSTGAPSTGPYPIGTPRSVPDPAASGNRGRPPAGRAAYQRSAPPWPDAQDPGYPWPDPQRPAPQRPEPPRRPVRQRARDASRWYWLLWLPIVVPLLPFLYNRRSPELAGLPFYYWGQFALVLLAAGVLAIVHVATKDR